MVQGHMVSRPIREVLLPPFIIVEKGKANQGRGDQKI